MDIEREELERLRRALDYMEDAITDVVGWANDPGTKLRYMHECKRIHTLAIDQIEEIIGRESKIQSMNIRKGRTWLDRIRDGLKKKQST